MLRAQKWGALPALKALKTRRVAIIGGLTAIVLVAAASFASAALVQKFHGEKVVVACYKTDTGAVRIVKKMTQCKSDETVLRWYRTGKDGLKGATGATGAKGANGSNGTNGATLLSGAHAPISTDGACTAPRPPARGRTPAPTSRVLRASRACPASPEPPARREPPAPTVTTERRVLPVPRVPTAMTALPVRQVLTGTTEQMVMTEPTGPLSTAVLPARRAPTARTATTGSRPPRRACGARRRLAAGRWARST